MSTITNLFSSSIPEQDRIEVQPVVCAACDFETWRLAPNNTHSAADGTDWKALMKMVRRKVVGRRCNDGVEMFEIGMGEVRICHC